ncbi:MAG: hypothetical protein HDS25_06015 [Bacteroides sp.]|nr:hypothetical protein [Bacteroides sp.]
MIEIEISEGVREVFGEDFERGFRENRSLGEGEEGRREEGRREINNQSLT